MAKFTDNSVMDAALDKLAEADKLCVCSAQATTYYEAVDPAAWVASTTYAVNDVVRPTSRNGFVYQATAITTGTSAASQPTWPTTAGNTVVDGGVTWTCRVNYSLAQGSLVVGDFTKANGDTSGRKTTLAAKTGLSIHTSGNANHIATIDDATKGLRDITTCTAQALTSGGTVDTSAFKHEIAAPT